MLDTLTLLGGILCAFAGGELFLRGVLGVSAWLRIPKAVTAATLAAFATSSPEVSVAVNAALAGTPQIALGDAVGSNIVNIGLVLGIVLCIGRVSFEWKTNLREWLFALLIPFLLIVFLADSEFNRMEAGLCLSLFTLWLLLALRQARRARTQIPRTLTRKQEVTAVVYAVLGLGTLILAGSLIVTGASAIGTRLGMDAFLIGATIVALGTSAPELATAVVAKLRGHDEIGVGTLLGSNIFNCLFVTGITASIAPFREPVVHVLSSLLFGVVLVLALIPLRHRILPRSRGVVLLVIYALSVLAAWYTQRAIANP